MGTFSFCKLDGHDESSEGGVLLAVKDPVALFEAFAPHAVLDALFVGQNLTRIGGCLREEDSSRPFSGCDGCTSRVAVLAVLFTRENIGSRLGRAIVLFVGFVQDSA